MKKVFEDFDITLVGRYESVLESHGISTFVKNRFGTSGVGELPFVEVVPQLWVLDEGDAQRALELIEQMQSPVESGDWQCPECGTALDAAFTSCWKCAGEAPTGKPDGG